MPLVHCLSNEGAAAAHRRATLLPVHSVLFLRAAFATISFILTPFSSQFHSFYPCRPRCHSFIYIFLRRPGCYFICLISNEGVALREAFRKLRKKSEDCEDRAIREHKSSTGDAGYLLSSLLAKRLTRAAPGGVTTAYSHSRPPCRGGHRATAVSIVRRGLLYETVRSISPVTFFLEK